MTTPDADRVVLDTNVLLAATDTGRSDHLGAVRALNEWPSAGITLYTSGQILREYLVVATRPVEVNGLGLSPAIALANVQALRGRLQLMAEDTRVADRLSELIAAIACVGKRIHDANVVATMLVHGVDTIVTGDIADLGRFQERVRVLAL